MSDKNPRRGSAILDPHSLVSDAFLTDSPPTQSTSRNLASPISPTTLSPLTPLPPSTSLSATNLITTSSSSAPIPQHDGSMHSRSSRSVLATPAAHDLEKLKEAVTSAQNRSYSKYKSEKTVEALPNPPVRTTSSSSSSSKRGKKSTTPPAAKSRPHEAVLSAHAERGESTESVDTIKAIRRSTSQLAPDLIGSNPPKESRSSISSTQQPFDLGSSAAQISGTGASFWPQSSEESAMPPFSPSSRATPLGNKSLFPSPNLYDIVLQMNCEAHFLDTWWESLIRITREWYSIERMSLTLPVDSTDIENIPWGQKASFDAAGIKDTVSQTPQPFTNSSPPALSLPKDPPGAKSPPEIERKTGRPHFESRHSYAGYENTSSTLNNETSKQPTPQKRPGILRRKTDRARTELKEPSITSDGSRPPPVPTGSPPITRSISPNRLEKPVSMVYSSLRPLDSEEDALLDKWTLHEALERTNPLVLSRRYTAPTASNGKESATQDPTQTPFRSKEDPREHGKLAREILESKRSSTVDPKSIKPRTDASKFNPSQIHEEHEQVAVSPWSQSPAPSPAIQTDPEKNPFFTSTNLDEDSFTPKNNVENYDRGVEAIPAIGVEDCVTIIHIPLMNPAAFRNKAASSADRSDSRDGVSSHKFQQEHSATAKTPIAVLSMRAKLVPYPENLRESLKNLAPHLSTSFSNSYQNSCFQERFTGAFQLHKLPGRSVTFAPRPTEGLTPGIESLLRLDLEEASSSTAASMISPSEYSSRSRVSPSSSRGITPAFEARDSYFDTKQDVRSVPTEKMLFTGSDAAEKLKFAGSEQQPLKTATSKKSENLAESLHTGDESHRRHSVLHSHGADLNASFNLLPVAAEPEQYRRMSRDFSASTLPETLLPPSERLLRTIIDSLPVQIFTAAPVTGDITWVNSKLLVYRGCTPEELREHQWEPVHPDDMETCKESWNQALLRGQQYQCKVRIRRFDGQYRWFFVRAAPLKDKFQNIVHWVGTLIDVHEQHLAEVQASKQQETAQSEAKWRGLANSSPQIVFAATRGEGITFCNLRWVEYSGQSELEAMGAGFLNHVHPEDVVKCRLPKFDDSGQENVPVSVPSDSPLTDNFEIHERPGASDQSSPSITNVTSSPNGMRLPQRKLSELASTGILRITRDSNGKTSYSTEVRLRMKSGEYRWHLVRAVLADSIDQIENSEAIWYGTATDINDHKELEQTLKETMDAKSRFLSNMSHEIRTPLNGIFGMANLLIDSHLTSEQLEQVNIIRASTEGLRDIINDILDLSKVEAGMITLNKDWFHIRSIIEDVHDLTASLAFDKGVELNYHVESDVPSVVYGDKFRFRQVLLNVIGNAIKFTLEGEIFSRCQIALNSQGMPIGKGEDILLQMDILDTGPGFNEKEAERLFKRFSQIDGSSTRQHGGSGLGLVISHELVVLHGGSMTATGEPGKGAIFTFTMRFGITPEAAKAYAGRVGKPKAERTSTSPRISSQSSVTATATSPEVLRSRPAHRRAMSTLNTDWSKPAETPMESRSTSFEPSSPTPSPKSPSSRPFSILVVCPLKWTRMTAINHIERVLTRNTIFRMDCVETALECRQKLASKASSSLTHIVLLLQTADEVAALVDYILAHASKSVSIVLVTDVAQRRLLNDKMPHCDFEEMTRSGKLHFVFKPLKPSKLAIVFDPERSRTLSRDQNQDAAALLAQKQKEMLDDITERIGNRGITMLLVEDNKINQMVLLKLLQRLGVNVEMAMDGVECVEKVFSQKPSHYGIILCDLHMPRKDGYQTCVEIRSWEKQNGYRHIPIIALSANVLGEVYGKCVDAGFNSYLTKPIEFSKLCEVLIGFLDPPDPSKEIEFMRHRPNNASTSSTSSSSATAASAGSSSTVKRS